MDKLNLIIGRGNRPLGEKIAAVLGVPETTVKVKNFADGEIFFQIQENVRGRDVFIIQSTQPPADNLMELLLGIDAAKRASAKRITAVIPYYGYARQDRKDRPRVPISSKLVANLLTVAGADRILTMDLHAPQIQGFFDIPFDHIFASNIFIREYLIKREIIRPNAENPEYVVVSPDVGGVKMCRHFAGAIGTPLAIVHKERPRENEIGVMELIGSVDGKTAIVRDDMVDTGGTLCRVATLLKERGADKVLAVITHALLSDDAVDRIRGSEIDRLVVADTVPVPQEKRIDKMEQLSVAEMFARAIESIHFERSISTLFNE